MNQNSRNVAIQDNLDSIVSQFTFTIQNHLVTLDGYHFTGILVNEVFRPALQHTGCQLATKNFLQRLLINLNLLGEVEDFQDILIVLKADSSQQSCNGQFLLTVDVCVHNIVNVCSKLDPASLEGDDTGRIQLRTIGMNTTTKEYTRRTVQL